VLKKARIPEPVRTACFFAPVADREVLERVEFYKQDLDVLENLGFRVTIATRWHEIPWDCDFYFVWWWTRAFLPLLKARLRRRPVLVTGVFDYRWDIPGHDYHSRPAWQRWLLRQALQNASANVFVSRIEYEMVTRELGARNALYVPLALDPQLYSPGGGEEDETVLTVAWMQKGNAERKCVPEIVRTIPLVLARNPGTRFIIAGERGTAYPEIAALARTLGVDHAVEFPGVISRSRKIELMRRCRVYLQPSRYEGFGMAILEAMSCGAAVVSSAVGAVPEVVGDAGLFVDGGSPEAIAEAVNRFLEDKDFRREAGQLGRSRAETLFPLERRRRELGQAIRDLLNGPGEPPG
jgi:glycosyltransferase involved in cell wall biosynthesis